MRYLLVLLFGLFFTPNAYALDACMSGSWSSPQRDGEGIVVEALEEQVLVYFYTFASSGTSWYLMLGDQQEGELDAIQLTMKQAVLISNNPFAASIFDVGKAVIAAVDDKTLQFYFDQKNDIVDGGGVWCLSDRCSGDFEYTRITGLIPCE